MNKPDVNKHNPDPHYLRELLDKAGLSQRAAAAQLGVSDRAMRKWTRLPHPESEAPYLVQFALEALASTAAGEEIYRPLKPCRAGLVRLGGRGKTRGNCEKCGCPTIDGLARVGCRRSPTLCDACGYAPCIGGCLGGES